MVDFFFFSEVFFSRWRKIYSCHYGFNQSNKLDNLKLAIACCRVVVTKTVEPWMEKKHTHKPLSLCVVICVRKRISSIRSICVSLSHIVEFFLYVENFHFPMIPSHFYYQIFLCCYCCCCYLYYFRLQKKRIHTEWNCMETFSVGPKTTATTRTIIIKFSSFFILLLNQTINDVFAWWL